MARSGKVHAAFLRIDANGGQSNKHSGAGDVFDHQAIQPLEHARDRSQGARKLPEKTPQKWATEKGFKGQAQLSVVRISVPRHKALSRPERSADLCIGCLKHLKSAAARGKRDLSPDSGPQVEQYQSASSYETA